MALKLYMDAIRVVLKIDSANENSWSRIYGSICCLRQSLLCAVCQKLVKIPQRRVFNKCEHSYCKRCVKGKKPQCKWCKRKSKFENHVRLRIILQCYKKMCRYILASGICRCLDKTKLTSPMLRFISMVYEGAGLEDRYHHIGNSVKGPFAKKPKTTNAPNQNSHSIPSQSQTFTVKAGCSTPVNINLPKDLTENPALADKLLTVYPIPDPSSDDSEIGCPNVIAKCVSSVKKKRSCRCGMTSRFRGNLRCCSQRCPCFVNGRACISCRCRGCRNPQKNLISSPPHHSDNYHDHKISKKTYTVIDHDSSSD